MGDMNLFQVIVIAIVEGLTEFLPVSSTGHMIIAQNVLGVESTEFVKAFTFIIQFGAILSVVVLYWKRFFHLNHDPLPEGTPAFKRFIHKYDFYWKLFVAFIPAAVLGLLFSDMIDAMLESVMVVAIMLVVGGVFMLFCDKLFGNGSEKVKSILASPNACFIDQVETSARHLVPLSEELYQQEQFVDTAYFEPFYLKDFIATVPKKKII